MTWGGHEHSDHGPALHSAPRLTLCRPPFLCPPWRVLVMQALPMCSSHPTGSSLSMVLVNKCTVMVLKSFSGFNHLSDMYTWEPPGSCIFEIVGIPCPPALGPSHSNYDWGFGSSVPKPAPCSTRQSGPASYLIPIRPPHPRSKSSSAFPWLLEE